MNRVCPTCGRSYPSEQSTCPADGTDLILERDYDSSAYDVTHHSTPGVDATGIPLPQPPVGRNPSREVSSPSATQAYGGGGGSQLGLTPAPSSNPGVRDLSTPTGAHGLSPMGTGRELSTHGLRIKDIQISPGDMINEYQIMGRLGEGGMGTVYEGVQPVIGKRVAIKVLLREYASNAEVVNRFIQEARVANQARSRYIVDIFSFGDLCDGRHYFVMEYLDGKSLREVLDERKVLPFDEAYAILSCMAKGLAAAHKVGVIHRDIKPENIVVLRESDGGLSAKVLDFGIAKLQGTLANPSFATKTGAALGTPYYMSPEQCRGQDVDHRTDVYALGIITFEIFAGALPYTAGSYIELVNKHLFASPPPPSKLNPDISVQLEAFILRCIAKDPQERPQSMDQFRSELAELVPSLHKTHPSAVHVPVIITPDTRGTSDPVARRGGKTVGLMVGILGLLVAAGVGGGAYLWYASHPPQGDGPSKQPGASAKVDAGATDPKVPARPGTLELVSEPPGARVLVDGKAEAQLTPLTLKVTPGKHRVRFELAGSVALEQLIEVRADEKQLKRVTLTALAPSAPRLSRLEVATGEPEARYQLDGKTVGQGETLRLEQLKPGTYELKISAPRRVTAVRSITLEPDKTFSIELKLDRRGSGKRHPTTNPGTKPGIKPGIKPGKKEDPDETIDPFRRKKAP